MLVISRRVNESVDIGDDITVIIRSLTKGRVELAIEAPKEMRINRSRPTDNSHDGGSATEDDDTGKDATDSASVDHSRTTRGAHNIEEAAECEACHGYRTICPRCDGIGKPSVESRVRCDTCKGDGDLPCSECGM